ncbi:hypothetical protein [Silvimonas amylolytica]|uniref:Type VI secretion protein n=1 Tax=Silvimonas amylolytica TaxID=449663 RepID=A0ABQ2PM06_9NEIS|nr:hypothetical protein [Silvimonas amylolytica]GGP26356.1 hypothetical protein GCM10010971_21750 [Silvimonas amylolytica]
MPVELEDLPSRKVFTLRPWGPMVWVALFLLCALVGMAAVTFFWPAGKPTMTLKWWNWLAIFPGCVFGGLCALYYVVFGTLHNEVIDWNEDHDDVWDEETTRGQKTIRLYQMAYATPLGLSHMAQQLVDNKSALSTVDIDGLGHVTCAPFLPNLLGMLSHGGQSSDLDADEAAIAAYSSAWDEADVPADEDAMVEQQGQWDAIGGKDVASPAKDAPASGKLAAAVLLPALYEHLALAHAKALRSVPVSRLRVCLAFNEALGALDPVKVWQEACTKANLGLPEPELLPDGLMALDHWLDERDSGKSFPLTLVVSVTRFDAPPARGGDAAVAMLLGPDVNDKHLALPPIAWVHRPELLGRVDNPVPLSMEYALRWGGLLPELLGHVWFSGLDQDAQVSVLSALPGIGLPPDDHPRIDVSTALGYTDVTGGWLALAAAVEHGQGNGKVQYIVAADPEAVAMVVEPVQHVAEPDDAADAGEPAEPVAQPA